MRTQNAAAQEAPREDRAALEAQLARLDAEAASENPEAKRRRELKERIEVAKRREVDATNARDLDAQQKLEAGHSAAVNAVLSRLRDLDDDFEALDTIVTAHRRLSEELKARGAVPRLLAPVPVDLGGCSALSVERLAALARSFGLFGGDQGLWLLPLARR